MSKKTMKLPVVGHYERIRIVTLAADEFSCRLTHGDDVLGAGNSDPDDDEPVVVQQIIQRTSMRVAMRSSLRVVFRGIDVSDRLTDIETEWLSLVLRDKNPLSRVDRDRLRFRVVIDYLENEISLFLPSGMNTNGVDNDDWYEWIVPIACSGYEESAVSPLLLAWKALADGKSPEDAGRCWLADAAKSVARNGRRFFDGVTHDEQLDTCPTCGNSDKDTPFLDRLNNVLSDISHAVDLYKGKLEVQADGNPAAKGKRKKGSNV